jgi:hypothetical protein
MINKYGKEFLLKSYMYTSEAGRKTYYEIPPRKNFNSTAGILISLLLLSILSLFLLKTYYIFRIFIFTSYCFLAFHW